MRTRGFRRITVFVKPIWLFGACAIAQDPGPGSEWPCGGRTDLLADKSGAPVWIDFRELKQHAINAPLPEIPAPFRIGGRVVVDVLIDGDGAVRCLRVPTGHPSLRLAAARTATLWTFRPFVSGKNPVAVFGHLEFTFGQ
jgi:hypothetical protein